MAAPVVVRHGHMKLWVNDASLLPKLIAAIVDSQVDLDVGLLGRFVADVAEVAASCGVEARSLREVAQALRRVGASAAANKLNRINIAHAILRHITSCDLNIFVDEIRGALAGAGLQGSHGKRVEVRAHGMPDVSDRGARNRHSQDFVGCGAPGSGADSPGPRGIGIDVCSQDMESMQGLQDFEGSGALDRIGVEGSGATGLGVRGAGSLGSLGGGVDVPDMHVQDFKDFGAPSRGVQSSAEAFFIGDGGDEDEYGDKETREDSTGQDVQDGFDKADDSGTGIEQGGFGQVCSDNGFADEGGIGGSPHLGASRPGSAAVDVGGGSAEHVGGETMSGSNRGTLSDMGLGREDVERLREALRTCAAEQATMVQTMVDFSESLKRYRLISGLSADFAKRGCFTICWAPAASPADERGTADARPAIASNRASARHGAANATEAQEVESTFLQPRRLVTGGADKQVRIWRHDTQTSAWAEQHHLQANAHGDWVRDVSWRPHVGIPANTIASCAEDGTVVIWREGMEGERWSQLARWSLDAAAWQVSWSVTGSMLAVSTSDNQVRLYKELLDSKWVCTTSLTELGAEDGSGSGGDAEADPAELQLLAAVGETSEMAPLAQEEA